MTVFVFAPAWVSWKSLKTWGFVFDRKRGEWMKQALPLPSLVYDRCFCKSRRQLVQKRQFMQNVRHRPAIRMLGNGVSHKWATQQILQRYSEFRPFLPETALYRTPDSLERWLVRHGNAFLKPLSGCHGKGVLHMIRTSGGAIHVRGRDAANRPLRFVAKDARSLAARIDPLVQRRKYLMQPAFTLQTKSGIPFDVRALVQKNRRGVWRTTGIAIRLGRPGSVTANLHGGGVALAAEPFLQREFGEATSSRLSNLSAACARAFPHVWNSITEEWPSSVSILGSTSARICGYLKLIRNRVGRLFPANKRSVTSLSSNLCLMPSIYWSGHEEVMASK